MKRKAHPPEHMGELNIIPYLDIVVNLVMFMLMSMTGFVTFTMINVTNPDTSDSPSSVSTPPPQDEDKEKDFVLSVSIARDGFIIAATGGVLGADETPAKTEEGKTAPTIPLKERAEVDGQVIVCSDVARPPAPCYDFEELTLKMASIKKMRPEKSDFFLAADRIIPYAVIVETMDATRGDLDDLLFPDVAFASIQ